MQFAIAGLAAAWLMGCGVSPQELCRQAVDVACKKTVECVPGGITEAECRQQAKQDADCDKAEPCHNGKYNPMQAQKCIDELKAATCQQLMTQGLPQSCDMICQ
ncbi:MAG: hypothetical protein RMK29_17960 [Myxococcales bacterium]|nr:hypothetical protein [Myxococcota bacterium]MDW8283596.1 hypothetical protein [Myxococcales bacterium]